MHLSDILEADRILVDADGGFVSTKSDAIRLLASMLSGASGIEESALEQKLVEREKLVSTGIGDGVAIPHTSLESATRQVAGLLLCPNGVDFDAVDREDVHIIFGVVGPKQSTGAHLRVLARISRLLRDAQTRNDLVACKEPHEAYRLLRTQDEKLR